MIKNRNAIYVAKLEKYRQVKLYTNFEGTQILLDINHFGFNETQIIATNLKNVLDGIYVNEYEWSGMRASFEETIEKTIIEDMTVGGVRIEMQTSCIYQLIRNRLEFMKSLNEDDILEKVKVGFETIKAEVDKYRLRDCFYQYIYDETEINFLLLDSDLILSAEAYCSTLKVNKFFLN